IDWNRDAPTIHNLVRAVAPPYPGAFTAIGGRSARVLRARVADPGAPRTLAPALGAREGRLLAHCGGGGALEVLSLEVDGATVTPAAFAEMFGEGLVALGAAE